MRPFENRPHADCFTLSSLVPFLIITFGVAWGIIALYVVLPQPMAALFGEISGQHPLFYLATYAPAIAALVLVAIAVRWSGIRRFLSRLLRWRASAVWYLFLLIGIPALFYGGAVWKGVDAEAMIPVESVGGYVAALLLFAVKGPVEEIGWRGFALPVLQRRMAPLWAGLVLGIIWGVWHLPAFFLSGTPQSAWSFTDFFIGTVALSVIATALFNASRGSILLPALFHLQLINPLWPDAQPYDTIPFVAAAAVVVWLNRDSMLRRDGGVTEIIPEPQARESERHDAEVHRHDVHEEGVTGRGRKSVPLRTS
jgi:membrane protease YdiL (CAAX protease family)